ncbi:hypothetical protein A4X13_0g8455 [Tilletia indica]|uniref:Uncharacterized protein n=1 Tax=Tilletia indica TaxID=43049 RepID=A0A8T8SEN4_9BASI|nr:hypothetical protein A4X13_0g8455 [Tilletia indica]
MFPTIAADTTTFRAHSLTPTSLSMTLSVCFAADVSRWSAMREAGGRKRGLHRILEMVEETRGMRMEVCTNLRMLTPEQAV